MSIIAENISHFKIIDKLGEGGMGEVYLAEDLDLERRVAIKFLPQHLTRDNDNVERFKREAKAAASLNHPNIITIYEIGEFEDQIYIAMEYIKGQTLGQIIQMDSLSSEQATEFAIAIADALSLAHRKGIIHRDVKPANIMVVSEEYSQVNKQIKLLDFGLAKLKGLRDHTEPGLTAGTLAYMSPEQARGEHIDQRSDIFAFGAVFYEMICGSPPFTGEYEAAVLYSLLNEQPITPSQLRPGIPKDLEEIICKAMAKDPDRRYQAMNELLVDLADYQYKPQRLAEKAGPEKKSIAVLPFEDISPEKQNEYLADGMSEELILALSQHPQIRVIARTSVMQYKAQAKDIRDIGRELDVSYVLEGSVRRYEDNLRITAQLIDAIDGSHLWADKFDGVMRDIFSFQEKVASQVTAALQVELGDIQPVATLKTKPQSKAYEYYLQGKLLLDTPSLENLDRSEVILNRALQMDPHYAAAYGSLASCYLWNVDTGLRPDSQYLLKAEKIARKALSIENDQPDALYTLANLTMKKGKVEEAFDGFNKVMKSNSNHGHARWWRAILLYYSSFFEKALDEADRLLATDPFWPMAHWLRSTIRLHQGMFDSAVAEYEQVVSEVPSKLVWLALAYRYADKMDKAWEAARKVKQLDPEGILWQMAFAFLEGVEGKGKKILNYIDERVKGYSWDFVITVYWVASYYAMAGQKDEAFRWLEQCIAIGNRNYRWFERDPNLEPLRSDPRYVEILEKAQREAEKLKSHFNKIS
jgi:serine/threonine protein kinase/Tfp pilus assembly protein PilF